MQLPAAHMLDRLVDLSSAPSRMNIATTLNDLLGAFVLCGYRNPTFDQWTEISVNDAHCYIHFREKPPFIIPAVVASVRYFVDWGSVPKTLIDNPAVAAVRRRTIIIEINATCFICLTDCELFFEATYPRRPEPSWTEVNADEGRLSVPWPRSKDLPPIGQSSDKS